MQSHIPEEWSAQMTLYLLKCQQKLWLGSVSIACVLISTTNSVCSKWREKVLAFNLIEAGDEHLFSAVVLIWDFHKSKRFHRVKMLNLETATCHDSLRVAWWPVAQEMSNFSLYSPSTPQDSSSPDFLTLVLHSFVASIIKHFLDFYVKYRPYFKQDRT